MKTKWNLKLLYKSPTDPQIEKDAKAIERVYAAFEKKYRGKNFTKDESSLLRALKDYEHLSKISNDGKPERYFWFVREIESNNNFAEARIRQLDDRFTKAANRIQFFGLLLGKIDKKSQKKFLKSSKLGKYHYFLKRTFETSKYDLSEPEEKILSLKSSTSSSMWSSGVEKAINKQIISFKGKKIPINQAMGMVPTITDTKSRRDLWDKVATALYGVGDFAESEINAVFTNKKVNDELRGFSEAYSATILGYENDPKVVLGLVDVVTKNFAISRKFLNLKRRLLKLSHLEYADRAVSIGKSSKKYPFKLAAKLVGDAFESADKKYKDVLTEYLKNGQIDVLPRANKGGGAFCASGFETPTYVLLNHVNDFNSVMTLAHEMGHAIHGERSKSQKPMYRGYSTAVAETASTFFEGLAFEHIVENLPKGEKIIALHNKIHDDLSTIFRQIAFFNFELELHKAVRNAGWVPKEEIAKMLNRHMKEYMGSAVRFKDLDGYFFIAVSHFRRPFYVYSYAYGQLISKALLERYKKNPSYIKKVDKFLSAGRSKRPEQIFKDIGIIVGPKLFEEGLESIEADIKELERLTK